MKNNKQSKPKSLIERYYANFSQIRNEHTKEIVAHNITKKLNNNTRQLAITVKTYLNLTIIGREK